MSLSLEGSKEREGRRGNRFTIAPVGVSLERWRVELDEEGEDKVDKELERLVGGEWEAKANEESKMIPPRELIEEQLLPLGSNPPANPTILAHFTSIATFTLSGNKTSGDNCMVVG